MAGRICSAAKSGPAGAASPSSRLCRRSRREKAKAAHPRPVLVVSGLSPRPSIERDPLTQQRGNIARPRKKKGKCGRLKANPWLCYGSWHREHSRGAETRASFCKATGLAQRAPWREPEGVQKTPAKGEKPRS